MANALADTISLVYKAPMVLPPLPYTSKDNSIITNNFDYLTAYVINRYIKNIKPSEILDMKADNLTKILKYSSYTDIEEIYEALLSTPADTRPGKNFSSLAAHMNLTSLIGWLIFGEAKDIPYYRLAAILHDVGKIIKPEAHLDGASLFFNEVIQKVKEEGVKGNIIDYLGVVKDRVEKHHSLDFKPDHIAAENERFPNEKIEEVFSKNEECSPFSEMLNQKSTADSINIENKWIKELGEEEYRKRYSKCSALAYDHIMQNKGEKKIENNKVNGYIYYINFPGVQSFIEYFSNLKDISTASFMVDFIVSTLPFVHFDNLLQKTRLPLEALLAVSGGHSILVGRSDVEPEKFIDDLKNDSLLRDLDIELPITYKPFFVNENLASYDVISDLMRESQFNSLKFKGSKILSLGLHRICDNCKERPAVDKVGEEYLCSRCKTIKDFANKRGFSARVKPKYIICNKEVDIGYNGIDPMVFISGGNSDDDPRYVSIIKFDANDASMYFANTLTWSEYVDKSFYTDYWIKKSLRETAKEYYNKNQEMVKRLIAGIQFLGGDEGLLISPALISINFMIDMIKKVYRNTGVTFKVGIVTVKPDHPVQFAVSTAEKIMDEAKIEKDEVNIDRNSIGILVSPSFVSPSAIRSFQRFGDFTILSYKNTISEVEDILNDVKVDISGKDENFKDFVREMESIVQFLYMHKNINETIIYLIRERVRHKEYSQLIDKILKSYKIDEKKINILDIYFILKSIDSGFSKVRE
ncbi:hypothetical protein [Acidianus brierleyi]|uniref:HD domain-containing protein n=1 Tax=Acidianus brierleyi TaxID=41673 RepID=A0A2U9IHD9_9CREN|nr:hypothetical protein [Acidianus brierleyi]AWR95458.1 hypothetical protein DFR85_13515 [Acidianus brierleyi]